MMTMDNYYSPKLFNDIKKWIGKDQSTYRLGSIGLHPAVPAYNGFYTIDGYSNFYSLEHKLDFRTIIEPEIKNNKHLLYKFDAWGNRCYLFSLELLDKWNHRDYIIAKDTNILINKLNYNFNKMQSMGCEYIISTVRINLLNNPNLILKKQFIHSSSPYSIFLYELVI